MTAGSFFNALLVLAYLQDALRHRTHEHDSYNDDGCPACHRFFGLQAVGLPHVRLPRSRVLVPVLAFAESAKALIANASADMQLVRRLWLASMLVTALIMAVVWLPVLFFFGDIAGSLTDDAETLRLAVVAFGILLVPYVLFSFNTVTDSVFYGIGRTRYIAFQSVTTNGMVYLAAFTLYTVGAWIPTFEGVMSVVRNVFYMILFK